jgi:hypothetical protein
MRLGAAGHRYWREAVEFPTQFLPLFPGKEVGDSHSRGALGKGHRAEL